jgi:hypothetical protein
VPAPSAEAPPAAEQTPETEPPTGWQWLNTSNVGLFAGAFIDLRCLPLDKNVSAAAGCYPGGSLENSVSAVTRGVRQVLPWRDRLLPLTHGACRPRARACRHVWRCPTQSEHT